MSIAIVSSLIGGTGNRTTANRICTYLESQYDIYLCETSDYETADDFNRFCVKNNIKVVLGIHLVKSGRLLVDRKTPFIMIAGGTDMNVSVKKSDDVELMGRVVDQSYRVILFTRSMRDKALQTWPLAQNRFLVQPQGISMPTNVDYSFSDLFREFRQVELNFDRMNVFLLVSGIRSVKDPLYLSRVISSWHSVDPSICLLIIGPILDTEFAEKCKDRIKDLKGIYLFSEICAEKVYSLMRHSVAVVNSSLNEGMCGAILEAMCVGTPVIARSNEGNLSLVTDKINGLIYENEDEFLSKSSLLLSNSCLRRTLVENGKLYVEQNHSIDEERKIYLKLIRELIDKK